MLFWLRLLLLFLIVAYWLLARAGVPAECDDGSNADPSSCLLSTTPAHMKQQQHNNQQPKGGMLLPYVLDEAAGWGIDMQELREQIAAARAEGQCVR